MTTQTGPTAREQIREMKEQVVGQAKNSLQQARDRATSSLGESKAQLADQIGAAAAAFRRISEHLRAESEARIAGLTDSVARQTDQVATYLRKVNGQVLRRDLESLARRQPALVIGGALALGLVGARFLKSSERESNRGTGNRESPGPESHRRYGNAESEPATHSGMGGFDAGA